MMMALACFALCQANFGDEAPAGMVKLHYDLPQAMHTGTPKGLKTANLETTRPDAPRAPIFMPPGCTNLALKQKVTSSDKEPVGITSMSTLPT